jgi:hypothetical protein
MLKGPARKLVVAALIPISLSAASCDPLFQAQAERMGVTVNEDGVPVIVAVPCPDERVVTMELLDAESVVEGIPSTYWRVRSDQAVVGKTYLLPINNQPPAAFDLVVRLVGDLPADIALLGRRQSPTNGDRAGQLASSGSRTCGWARFWIGAISSSALMSS